MPINASRFARHLGFAIPEKVFELSTLVPSIDFGAGRVGIGRANAVGPVSAALDAPPTAHDDHFTTDETTVITGSVFANNGFGADSDPDGPALTVATVNGSAGNVGVVLTLFSGATFRLNADGSFTYDPTGTHGATPAAGSGASNATISDFFAYTLTGGTSTALGTFTINGIDNNDILYGTSGPDTLHAGVGDDRLFGLAGADIMFGGTGNDLYFVDNVGDQINEADGEGNDSVAVTAAISYTLNAGASVELLTTGDVNGTLATSIAGNEFNNEIWGNAAVNTLNGGDGNDSLLGFGGNDILRGGAGADLMIGGAGIDTYIVDDQLDTLADPDSNSTILASVSYVAPAGFAFSQLSTIDPLATTAINLRTNDTGGSVTGNEGANILEGGSQGNTILGAGGDDILRGNGGNDNLDGGAGNDLLDGGTGTDGMNGQEGNDTYIVDNAGDFVIDTAGGMDTIATSITLTLPATSQATIELLITTDVNGTAAINLTGNELSNQIWGNAGNNTLNGGAGVVGDQLLGFGGNDTLLGGGGDDLLIGGDGLDTLIGGSEADTFAFVSALGSGNVDTVFDFELGVDKMVLEDSVFTGLATGALAAGAFNFGGEAHEADDRIIYNPVTGELFFDPDGTGAAAQVLFATMFGTPLISASDFTVV